MDTPISESIPIVSTYLKSINVASIHNSVQSPMDETPLVASNPSSSTPLIKSQLHDRHHENFDDLLNEYGSREDHPNERRPFEHPHNGSNERIHSIVHEVLPQPNNVVQSPPQIC